MKKRRCISKACGDCMACLMRQRWRDGLVDGQTHRLDRWTPEEDDLIRHLAGRVTPPEIVAALKRAGHHRTLNALRNRASHDLGVYLSVDVWSQARVCSLFGAWFRAVRVGFFESGLLPAHQLPPGEGCRQGEWRVAEADLVHFIRTCPWAYDAERMKPASHRLVRLARDIQRRDPWLPGREVQRVLGLTPTAFSRWVQKGVIPAKRRTVGLQGGVHGGYVVRAADIPEIRREIDARREEARFYIRENLLEVMRQRRAAARAA